MPEGKKKIPRSQEQKGSRRTGTTETTISKSAQKPPTTTEAVRPGRKGGGRTQEAGRKPADDLEAYIRLIRRFPLRPLRTEEELDQASQLLDELQGRAAPLRPLEADYVEVLGNLVENYEEEHHPMPAVSGADMLRHLMEARGVTQTEVASVTGILKSTLSAVLTGKRELNRNHIEKLAPYFGVGPGAFLPG